MPGRRGAGRAPRARGGRRHAPSSSQLEPLSESAVASLSGDGADDVYAATGGNPFYVTELLASRTDEELPRSITNAVRGRVSRLSDEERRLVELVSVVPNRVATSVLDAVLPDWPAAAEEPERRALLEVAPALRPLPARARAQRDQVEHPDRRAPPAARGDPRSAARRGRRPGRHRPPRRGGRRGGRRRRLRARRGAAGGGARLEPRGLLPLPARLGVPRPTLRARAGRGARGAGGRRLRRLPARRRLRRDRARDRRMDRPRRRCGRRPLHADPLAVLLARGRRRRRAGEGARGDRDPRAARRVGRARPCLQRPLPARESGRVRRPGARLGGAGARARDPARRRAHAGARARQHRQRQAGRRPPARSSRSSRLTPSRTRPATGTRRRARSATSPTR